MKSCTELMGIINITTDSFSGDGIVQNIDDALSSIAKQSINGVLVIDIGAESSNPKSKELDPGVELKRLKQFLPEIFRAFPNEVFSLDTASIPCADYFLSLGGAMINNYKGLYNTALDEVVLRAGCPYIINHFPGQTIEEVHTRPKMQSLLSVYGQLAMRRIDLYERGIKHVLLDPGIGFGKSPELNWKLLSISEKARDREGFVIGFSKKRFLGEKRMEKEVNARAAKIAIESGAAFIRVHNPEWYKELICHEA